MPDTTTATAEDIGAAIALLRTIPGVTEQHTLDDIAEISTPLVQLAHSLTEWINDHHSRPDTGQIASVLDHLAAEHGLRITTDPDRGEVIKLALVRQDPDDGLWRVSTYLRPDEQIPTELIADGLRVATMHLLPEGGQA